MSFVQVVETMRALCEFFPGADTPINYDDLEDDDEESVDDDYLLYSTRDSFDTENIPQAHNPVHYTDEVTSPVVYRHGKHSPNLSPRPRSFVESQVSRLQNLMANENQPKTRDDLQERTSVRIPQQFRRDTHLEPGSSVTINRTSSSPVPDRTHMQSEGSTPQDTLRVFRSPVVFSESSSPRGISPIVNYNIGNMNPRHIDMDQYWNRENDKLSPASRTPSALSTNSTRKEDYNQNYCDRVSAANSPMTLQYNGNTSQVDPRYQTPLQIEVDPVSILAKKSQNM